MTVLHIPDGIAQERAKYAEVWSIPEYKEYSPGLEDVDRFMGVIDPPPHSTLIDLGCGAGVAGVALRDRGLSVDWLDLTDAGLDDKVNRKRFIEAPLWDASWMTHRKMGWDYGFCCDVLEHLPIEYTMLAISNMLAACRTLWLQVCLRPEDQNRFVRDTLHLTVCPYDWWLIRIATLGRVIDARDLCQLGLYIVRRR